MTYILELTSAELAMLNDALNQYGKNKRKENELKLNESINFYEQSRDIEKDAEVYTTIVHKLKGVTRNRRLFR